MRALTLRTRTVINARALACAAIFLCALGSCAQTSAQTTAPQPPASRARLEGTVRDESGAAVAGAQVSLRDAAREIARTTSDGEGRFSFDGAADETGDSSPRATGGAPRGANARTLLVVVNARGFARVERALSAEETAAGRVRVTLALAGLAERVEVSATRTEQRRGEAAPSVATLSERDVETTAALRLDDALRQTVGFQLFRRAGSRAANPTTQGVSLRGTGASGASRAAVFADGVPLNDPFGGWVYWDRVPREEVSRVEVLRGGASALYGGGALGGVVNIFTRRADANALALEASYGNERTPDGSLYAATTRGGWSAGLGAEMFSTRGYVLVDERARGRVDTPASSRDSAFDLTLARKFKGDSRAFLRGSVFGESRANGTPLQTNRTHARQLSAGFDLSSSRFGSFDARAYGGAQVYDQNFTAVAADRNSETLTRAQRSPSQSIGASVLWSRAVGSRQTLVAGLEAREVRGSSDEIVFAQGRATSLVGAGGRERDAGVFAEDVARLGSKLIFTFGARYDRWREYDAASTTRPLRQGSVATVARFPERDESAASPRASALYKVSPQWSLTASAYRAFRQPTLNELYRSFRVGDVLTLANENLRAERLAGGEAGAVFASRDQKFDLRATFFWTEITRPVANVTLSAAPGLITRRRENLGRTRARGVEIETEARLSRHLSASGGYLFVEPTVLEFPANRALEGLQVPQVARQQLTFQLRYDSPSRWTAGVQGRASSSQFDDDQNLFRLAPYFTLDAYASRRVARDFELFAAAENLLDRRSEVARTPILTLGTPLVARFGFRVRLSSR
ncbi:MAG: TonB-dependent receptor [Pyrinomonadaceae bacterium]